MAADRLLALAQMLLDEGYVDNEADARLAALNILAAAADLPTAANPPPAENEANEAV
jgi:hypothetical protein